MRWILFSVFAALVLSFGGHVLAAVDINSADESQLEALPGIGPTRAREIVADRSANGPFRSVDDLGRVKGIGEKTLANLREHITISADSASATKMPTDDKRRASVPASPERHFPWGIVIVAVVVVGGIAWFVFRRRVHAPDSGAPRQGSADRTATAPVPASGSVGPAGVGVAAGKPSGGDVVPPPAPAGPRPTDSPRGQGTSADDAPRQPMPAGMRPAGMPSSTPKPAGPGAPPAPAGSKPK